MKHLSYLIANILYQTMTVIAVTNNPPTRIYVNKIENRITFKIKKKYYLDVLSPQTIKFLGSTKSKITKDKNAEIFLI